MGSFVLSMPFKNSPNMRKGFTKIPNELRDLPLSIEAIGLYTWLSLHADQNGQIITSYRQIVSLSGMSLQRVRTAMKLLLKTQVVTQVVTQGSTQVTTILTISFLKDCSPQKNVANTSANTSANTNIGKSSRAYKNDNIIISCLNLLKNNKKEKEYNYFVIALERIGENANSMSDKSDAEVQRLVPIFIKEYYNLMVETNKSRMGKIKTNIINQRLAFLWARIKESGLDNVLEVINKATQSNFLNGAGGRGFIANFEWIMRPNNFPKVLEGTYDNREQHGYDKQQSDAQRRAAEAAAIIERLANQKDDDPDKPLW
jgi:hypothetical protein